METLQTLFNDIFSAQAGRNINGMNPIPTQVAQAKRLLRKRDRSESVPSFPVTCGNLYCHAQRCEN